MSMILGGEIKKYLYYSFYNLEEGQEEYKMKNIFFLCIMLYINSKFLTSYSSQESLNSQPTRIIPDL